MTNSIVNQVIEKLNHLPHELQQKVLDFVDALTAPTPQGMSGQRLLRFAGVIPFDDLQLMRQVIETGCEQVDVNEW